MYNPSGRATSGGGFSSREYGGTSFKPKRYALSYNPPTFILEYGDDSLGLLRTRKFRLKKIATEDNLERTAEEVVRKFPSRINRSFVSKEQILRLLQGLKQKMLQRNQALMVEADLNKYNTEELDQIKEQMNETFVKNALKPGDDGYVYDVQRDFGQPTEDNDWDSTDEETDLPLP